MPNHIPALANRFARPFPLPNRASVLGLSVALLGGLSAQAQDVQVQIQEVAAEGIGLTVVAGGEDEDIYGPDYEPGFQVQRGDDREALDAAINDFHRHLDNSEWEKAFRKLIDLTQSTQHILAPLGDSPIYRPIRRSIQERLRSLPLEGRRAFQQFYDAQAREMLSKARGYDQPGSDEQVMLAREVFEMFLMTSSGDAAADLLGNLYFERGEFAQAQACWQAILEHHPGTSLPELELQFKRVVAMHRAGRVQEAHDLAEQLALRFAGREVAYGGGQVNAAQALRDLLGDAPDQPQAATSGQTVPAGLPAANDLPLWQMTFANDATVEQFQAATGRRNYYGPTDLRLLTPPTAADDSAVYAHWHGVVFALDLASGKLLWRTGRFTEAASTLPQRMSSATGTPRGYKIALTDRLVLVQSSSQRGGGQPFDRFNLTAYDKATGETAWDSSAMPDWRGHSFCGQPLVIQGQAYVITHPVGAQQREGQVMGNARSLTLHRIDAVTGKPQWSLPLGDADVAANPYIQFVWMPQPTLMLEGTTLYVLTNNGAVMAVDTGAGEVAWAARLHAPEGLGNQANRGYNIQPPSANAQGAGAMFMRDGVLYAKEARSPRIYAIDPQGPTILWERSSDNPEAELIGVNDHHIYVMAHRVRAYPLPDREGRVWNNNQIGGPSIGSGLISDDTLYVMGNNKLWALSLQNGDKTESEFSSRHLRGNGGQLLMADDKIICVTQRDITVFRVPAQPAPSNHTPADAGE